MAHGLVKGLPAPLLVGPWLGSGCAVKKIAGLMMDEKQKGRGRTINTVCKCPWCPDFFLLAGHFQGLPSSRA